MVKRLLRATVQAVVSAAAPALWRRRRDQLLVIMYHRVLPVAHPARASEQPGMYVSPASFAMHVDILRRHFTLVHLDDWLRARSAGQPLPQRACAITFDDGWRDNYDHAFPVLQAAGAPATIYLVSDLVGTSYSFWPNTLARLLLANDVAANPRLPDWLRAEMRAYAVIDTAAVDAIIASCKLRPDAEMQAVVDAANGGPPAARDLLSWEEVDAMSRSGLVRFGSHTRWHTRASGMTSDAQLQDEILGSRARLQLRLGYVPQSFCYPNGEVSEGALKVVRSGYLGAVTTERGWNPPRADAHLLRRVGVHEDVAGTPAAFRSRLAGVG